VPPRLKTSGRQDIPKGRKGILEKAKGISLAARF